MIVMDDTSCMVDVAKYFHGFTRDESCGKCTPCRVGTAQMNELLDQITRGEATLRDLAMLEDYATSSHQKSLRPRSMRTQPDRQYAAPLQRGIPGAHRRQHRSSRCLPQLKPVEVVA